MKEKLKYIIAGALGFAGALGWILYMDSLDEPDGITPKQIVMLIILFLLVIAAIVIVCADFNKQSVSVSHSLNDLNIISEMVKNGYSDEMIEMTKAAAKKSVSKPNLYLSYRDEVLFLVNAYFYRHEYDEAIKWLETLNIDNLRRLNYKEQINGYGVVSYYDAWMILCRATRDFDKAEKILAEAETDIAKYVDQKKETGIQSEVGNLNEVGKSNEVGTLNEAGDFNEVGKSNEVGILIEEIYYEYNFLIGDLDKAKKHAENIDRLYRDFNPKSISPDITMAEICKATGDIDGYNSRVKTAEEKLMKSNNAVFKEMFDEFIDKTKE